MWCEHPKTSGITFVHPRIPVYGFASDIAAIRNDLVMQALGLGSTHILFCDSDQGYPPDFILQLASRMITTEGMYILCPLVHQRYLPFAPVIRRGELHRYTAVPLSECYSNDLLEIDATGTGCLLVDLRVFLKLPRPWFKESISEVDGKRIGEDIHFCSTARNAGFKIWADTSIRITHFGQMIIDEMMHRWTLKTHGLKEN